MSSVNERTADVLKELDILKEQFSRPERLTIARQGIMDRIREIGLKLAETIVLYCPPCADRSAAVRKVREAVMTANTTIALEGK